MRAKAGSLALVLSLALVSPAWAADAPADACPDIPWLIKFGQHLIQQRDKLEEDVVKLMVEVERLKASNKTAVQPKQETPK